MKLSIDVKNINLKDLWTRTSSVLAAKGRWFFALAVLALLSYGAFLWYFYIINPKLSEAERLEYMNAKQNEILFDQKKFDAILAEIQGRKSEYENKIENVPDIFGIK